MNLCKLTKAQLIEEVQELQRWREAVSDALLGAELGPLQPGTSPVMALDWLINQHLEVADRERVEPLTDWQISQLELRVSTVRAVERALGVIAPGDELVRVSVPVAVPEHARAILEGCADAQRHEDGKDRAQEVWSNLLRAGGAIEPMDVELDRRKKLTAHINALPRAPVQAGLIPKIQLTAEHLIAEED